MTIGNWLLALALAIAAAPQAAAAEELLPLGQALADGRDQTYPLVRCAAFYQAAAEWARRDEGAEDAAPPMVEIVSGLVTVATAVRAAERSAGIAEVRPLVLADIRGIVGLYLQRFERNSAGGGRAFADDPLWREDSAICKALVEG